MITTAKMAVQGVGTRCIASVVRVDMPLGFAAFSLSSQFGRICNPTALNISICNAIIADLKS